MRSAGTWRAAVWCRSSSRPSTTWCRSTSSRRSSRVPSARGQGVEQAARGAGHCGREHLVADGDRTCVWLWSARRAPEAAVQLPVFGLGGRFIGTPDLVDPVRGRRPVRRGAAPDGRPAPPGRRPRMRLPRLGLETVTMMAGDRHDPTPSSAGWPRRTTRAGRQPARTARWTIEPPPWWTPTNTVARRRALHAVRPRAVCSATAGRYRGLTAGRPTRWSRSLGYFWTLARRHAEIFHPNVPVLPQPPRPRTPGQWEPGGGDQGRKRWMTQ